MNNAEPGEPESRDPHLARLLARTAPPRDAAGLVVARAMARVRAGAGKSRGARLADWLRHVRSPWRAAAFGLVVAGVVLGCYLPLPAAPEASLLDLLAIGPQVLPL